jgi:hypothetical protein
MTEERPIAANSPPLRRRRRLPELEQALKWLALGLGLCATVAVVQDWHPWTMFLSLPFCLIWIYCAWLHTERQLKWINIVFALLYVYGIARYFLA